MKTIKKINSGRLNQMFVFSWRLLTVAFLSIALIGVASAAKVTGPVTCVTGAPDLNNAEVNCIPFYGLELPYNSVLFKTDGAGGIVRDDKVLSKVGYTEEEYFLEGMASQYSSTTPLTADGLWNDVHKVSGSDEAYKIRMVVRRPINPNKFNGTVVVEVQHPSGSLNFDWAFMKDEIIDGGYAYVSVGPSWGFADLDDPKFYDPGRYDSIAYPSTIIVHFYDMLTQAAREVRNPSPMSADPMGGLAVERIVATGHSAGSNTLRTYINAIQPLENAFDGFLLTGNSGAGGLLLNFDAFTPPRPAFIRYDLGNTKVLNLLAEWDLISAIAGEIRGHVSRQPDSNTFRGYEYSGGAHVPRNTFPRFDLLLGTPEFFHNPAEVEAFYSVCQTEGNDGIDMIYVNNAMLRILNEWMKTGNAPPSPRLTVIEPSPGVFDFATDAVGNALGGIRPVSIDVPIALYDGRIRADPTPLDGDSCNQSSVKVSFTQEELDALYPIHGDYVTKVTSSAQDLKSKGFLRPYDFEKIIKDAAASDIGK